MLRARAWASVKSEEPNSPWRFAWQGGEGGPSGRGWNGWLNRRKVDHKGPGQGRKAAGGEGGRAWKTEGCGNAFIPAAQTLCGGAVEVGHKEINQMGTDVLGCEKGRRLGGSKDQVALCEVGGGPIVMGVRVGRVEVPLDRYLLAL